MAKRLFFRIEELAVFTVKHTTFKKMIQPISTKLNEVKELEMHKLFVITSTSNLRVLV